MSDKAEVAEKAERKTKPAGSQSPKPAQGSGQENRKPMKWKASQEDPNSSCKAQLCKKLQCG